MSYHEEPTLLKDGDYINVGGFPAILRRITGYDGTVLKTEIDVYATDEDRDRNRLRTTKVVNTALGLLGIA